MEPPLNTQIKSNIDTKLDKYYVKIKLHRNPTSETYDIYEFKWNFLIMVVCRSFFYFNGVIRKLSEHQGVSLWVKNPVSTYFMCGKVALILNDMWED